MRRTRRFGEFLLRRNNTDARGGGIGQIVGEEGVLVMTKNDKPHLKRGKRFGRRKIRRTGRGERGEVDACEEGMTLSGMKKKRRNEEGLRIVRTNSLLGILVQEALYQVLR